MVRRAFFCMRSNAVDEVVHAILAGSEGKKREKLVISVLEHPFFDDKKRLERRAEIIENELVNKGCSTRTTRELQILSIPKSMADTIRQTIKDKDVETVLCAISPARLCNIMERRKLEERRKQLVGEICGWIKNAPEPPSNSQIMGILTAGLDAKSALDIETALFTRCGFERVFGLIENIAAVRWPDSKSPVAGEWLHEKHRTTFEQSVREMERVLQMRTKQRQKGTVGSQDRKMGNRKVKPM